MLLIQVCQDCTCHHFICRLVNFLFAVTDRLINLQGPFITKHLMGKFNATVCVEDITPSDLIDTKLSVGSSANAHETPVLIRTLTFCHK
jgi:hypothetical protein